MLPRFARACAPLPCSLSRNIGSRVRAPPPAALPTTRQPVDSVQELFGEPPPGRAELGPQSRTASKRRAEEFRKLGRELAALPPRTLARMALPIDLAEALEEHARIESKRATGAAKKGRARVEALVAQLLTRYDPPLSARIEAATKRALAGEPFSAVEAEEEAAAPTRRGWGVASAAALAALWRDGLLGGEASVSTEVYGHLGALGEGWQGEDRVAIRNLVAKASAEQAKAAEAAEAAAAAVEAEAAAAAAAGLPTPPRPSTGRRAAPPSEAALLRVLTQLAAAVLAAPHEPDVMYETL